MGKGENAGNQHFLLFPKYFLQSEADSIIGANFYLSSIDAFNLGLCKIMWLNVKLKAFTDNKLKSTSNNGISNREETHTGKGEILITSI